MVIAINYSKVALQKRNLQRLLRIWLRFESDSQLMKPRGLHFENDSQLMRPQWLHFERISAHEASGASL